VIQLLPAGSDSG